MDQLNLGIPKPLEDAIVNDKLVIFVGAGLSTNCGLPDWTKLVCDLLTSKKEYINNSDVLLSTIDSGIMSPLEVLDKIQGEKKIVYDAFEKSIKGKESTSALHKSLGELSKRFVTTNFDTLIESNINISNVITKDSEFNLAKIDTESSFVIKAHGDISQIDKCVIFSSQYYELYQNEKLSTFQLKKIFSQYSVLFVGFSFNDPYVTELFDYVAKLMGGYGPKHFLISNENKEIKGINCINIVEYGNLPHYIERLGKCKSLTKVSIDDQTDPLDNKVIIEQDGGDIPPDVFGWIGRDKELDLLAVETFKVIYITGIGGEGKSALASHYLNIAQQNGNYDNLIWRDFKEEEHKFQHKISTMIQEVSKGIDQSGLAGLSNDELVCLFFKKLGHKKSVFVLDNVDSYIDLEAFEPTNGIGKLCDMALSIEHNSKFIFTCRPLIRHASVGFYQLRLTGLTQDNTIEYFLEGNVSISPEKLTKYAEKSHSLTNGHALWLSLIRAQARRGEARLAKFLEEIESGNTLDNNDSSILSEKVLNSIWVLLADRDRLVLRTLAESVKAETSEDYSDILRPELNYKNFQKALKALRNLNLIVERRETDYIELHPLVKEFIRKNYQISERSRYISLFIKYYDKFVFVLKERLSYKLSFDEFLNFTNKAELSINGGDFQSAITTLWEVHSAMSAGGYIEEFLRVSKLLFNAFKWSKKNIAKITNYESLLQCVIVSAVQYGDDQFADSLLNKFESLIENKEESYIRLCYLKSYTLWFRRDFDEAVSMCEEASYLLKRADQPDKYGVHHNQALAYRDSGNDENICKALDYFLNNNDLSELINARSVPKEGNGSLLGNVGKCLALQNELENALICFYK